MAERPRVDLVSIVSRIRRGPVDKDDAMEAEVAVDVLDFLDHACKATGCEPGWTAKLTVIDLCAAIRGGLILGGTCWSAAMIHPAPF